jgi:protein-S-isoprenylcysteine O-methyltransferase Ste14
MNIEVQIFLGLLPVSFIVQLLIAKFILRKKGARLSGSSPINKYIFYISKYSVILVWTGMILEIMNISIGYSFPKNIFSIYSGVGCWIGGFVLLHIGRFSLGQSFRIGVSNEKELFIASGIYKISRNPMYVGLYATIIGFMIYSLNVIYVIFSVFIIIVHHIITLNEEKQLLKRYGKTYTEYCRKVRRYI